MYRHILPPGYVLKSQLKTLLEDESNKLAIAIEDEIENQVKIDEEETSNIRDQLLLLIIGLLRTAKMGRENNDMNIDKIKENGSEV
ncbi:hypothetical protein AgCh_024959 [Apium graveolens]